MLYRQTICCILASKCPKWRKKWSR